MSKDQAEAMSPDRNVLVVDHYNQRFGGMVSDSLYMYRSGDGGRTWSDAEPFGIGGLTYQAHTGKDGVLQMPDGQLMLIIQLDLLGGLVQRGLRRPLRGRWTHVEAAVAGGARSRREGRLRRAATVAPRQRQAPHDDAHRRIPVPGILGRRRLDVARGQAVPDMGASSPLHSASERPGAVRLRVPPGAIRDPGLPQRRRGGDLGTWATNSSFAATAFTADLGYPASVLLEDGRVLTVYYFHDEEGMRHIGGSIYSEDEILP